MRNVLKKRFLYLLVALISITALLPCIALFSIRSSALESATNYLITPGKYNIINQDTLKTIDPDDPAVNGSIVEQVTLTGNNEQVWQFIHVSGDYYKIKNMANNRWLTSPVSGAEYERVTLETSNIPSRQKWKITQLSNGKYRLQAINREGTNLVLAVNSSLFNINVDGIDITQRDYTDAEERGEWRIANATLWNADDSAYYNGAVVNAAYWDKKPISVLALRIASSQIQNPAYFPPNSAWAERAVWGNIIGMTFTNGISGNEDIQIYGGDYNSVCYKSGLTLNINLLGTTVNNYSGSTNVYHNYNDTGTKNIRKISDSTCYIIFKPTGPNYDADIAKFSIIHEIGHAMGYTGHSPNTTAGALMRADPTTLPEAVFTPTAEEASFFKKIYDLYSSEG